MNKISIQKINDLLLKKYKATIITKQQFKESIYGLNRTDLDDDIISLSEGLIKSENCIFYLINNVEIINKYCKCLDKHSYPCKKTIPLPSSCFMPYIVIVAELSDDKEYVVDYAKWGSFKDTLFEELNELEFDKKTNQRNKNY